MTISLPQGYLDDIKSFILENEPSKQKLAKEKVRLARDYPVDNVPSDIHLLLSYDKPDLLRLKKYLMSKPIRTGSGVAVVAIMSAPLRCPHGKCTFCPGGPKSFFGDVPQSYTGNEPATMRGIRNDYDAYLQVMNRLEQYIALGQSPEKIELIIMGGTFPSYDMSYQEEFVRDALQAMNDFGEVFYTEEGSDIEAVNFDRFREWFEQPGNPDDEERTKRIKERLLELKENKKKVLEDVQLDNETARVRCIGMTIETKPDWGLLEHGNNMLRLGCTRVELGVQTLNDEVLHEVHRGHDLQDTKDSISILKDLGFKLNFHMMPGLPGISVEEDIETFDELFSNPAYRPDMLKVYPTMVMPGTKLYLDYKKGEYEPYGTEESSEVIAEAMGYVESYCRVMRVQRDIPTKHSKEGLDKNNLRQIVERKMDEKGIALRDIKAREIGRSEVVGEPRVRVMRYDASGGEDVFIEIVDGEEQLLGFVRVRFVAEARRDEFSESSAIVRELHVYGAAVGIGGGSGNSQHRGFGSWLMREAERVAKEKGCDRLLVISGIGVREYYRKLGYERRGAYMVKDF